MKELANLTFGDEATSIPLTSNKEHHFSAAVYCGREAQGTSPHRLSAKAADRAQQLGGSWGESGILRSGPLDIQDGCFSPDINSRSILTNAHFAGKVRTFH